MQSYDKYENVVNSGLTEKCLSHHFACDCREANFKRAFEYILNEAYLDRNASLVDIANEIIGCVGLQAKWTNVDENPIIVIPLPHK